MRTVMDDHSITLELKPEQLSATFVCDAGPTAPCHEACERQECEEGCHCNSEGREPEYRVYDECLIKTWLENMSDWWFDTYDGDPVEPHSGPIVVEWDQREETWLWHYMDAKPVLREDIVVGDWQIGRAEDIPPGTVSL